MTSGGGSFSPVEVTYLQSLPAVESCSATRIRYADGFKRWCAGRCLAGASPVHIFREVGLDPSLIGYKRIERCVARWKSLYTNTANVGGMGGAGSAGGVASMGGMVGMGGAIGANSAIGTDDAAAGYGIGGAPDFDDDDGGEFRPQSGPIASFMPGTGMFSGTGRSGSLDMRDLLICQQIRQIDDLERRLDDLQARLDDTGNGSDAGKGDDTDQEQAD